MSRTSRIRDLPGARAKLTEAILERMKMGMSMPIDGRLIDNSELELHEVIGFLADHLSLELRSWIASQQLEMVDVRYPKDWWQAFKQRWFPGWALERWPVQERWIVLRADAVYPNIALKDHEPTIFMRAEEHYDSPS